MDAAPSALARLSAEEGPLFAILDAAREPEVLDGIEGCDAEHASLYEGEPAEDLAEVAPYLVRLPAGSAFLSAIVSKGWGRSWGIFLTCDRPFEDVRRHLRHFLKAEFEGQGVVLFRFYDPRVLRVFLPTCTPAQAKEVFGPVSSFLAEGRRGETLLRFRADGTAVSTETLPVSKG